MIKKTIRNHSSNGLAMKKDLKKVEERLNKRIDRVINYIDFKINPFEELRRDFFNLKNKLFDRLDWLIGRYQKFEDEYTIQAAQNKRILDRLENHENRINNIKKSFKHN